MVQTNAGSAHIPVAGNMLLANIELGIAGIWSNGDIETCLNTETKR